MSAIELGLGLLSIGRNWGVANVPPPSKIGSLRLIEAAYERGIRFFDTAPAYGQSEAILGEVLRSNPMMAASSVIATKFGEHWDQKTGRSWVSHDREHLLRSLESSLRHLGRIDVLQVHKATAQNLNSDAVLSAFEIARACGVHRFGASVSDIEAAECAVESGQYQFLQFPLNSRNYSMKVVVEPMKRTGVKAIINRPLAMGALADRSAVNLVDAFRFVRNHTHEGVVLTGTSREEHLLENIAAFEMAGC